MSGTPAASDVPESTGGEEAEAPSGEFEQPVATNKVAKTTETAWADGRSQIVLNVPII